MKAFIGLSEHLSEEMGKVLLDWLPTVIQNVKTNLTSDNKNDVKLDDDISKELSGCNTGIIFLTKNNLLRSLIIFDVDEFSNQHDRNRICPILIELDNTDSGGPLSSSRITKYNYDFVHQLSDNAKSLCGDNKLTYRIFNEAFNVFWPPPEEKTSKGSAISNSPVMYKDMKETKRDDREILNEILELARMNSMHTNKSIPDKNLKTYNDIPIQDRDKLNELANEYLRSNRNKFKDISQVIPVDLVQSIEKDQNFRELTERPEVLKQFFNELL